MRTAALVLVACLLMFGLAIVPAASAAPEGPPGAQVCVPGLTLCCSIYDDGDVTPAIWCL